MENKANERWFQQQLKNLGAKIDVTGTNDAKSRAAISDFQRAMGVEVTGTETLDTVHALHDYKMKAIQGNSTAASGSGASVSGAVQPVAPVAPPVAAANPSETEPAAGRVVNPGAADFSETDQQQPLPINPAKTRPGDPTFAAMPPDTQKMLTDANYAASVDAHNQNVELTRSLAAHAEKMRGDALDPNNVAGSSAPPFVLDLRSVAGQ